MSLKQLVGGSIIVIALVLGGVWALIHRGVGGLEQEMTAVHSDLARLQGDQLSAIKDAAGAKVDLKTELADLATQLRTTTEKLSATNEKLGGLQARMAELDANRLPSASSAKPGHTPASKIAKK